MGVYILIKDCIRPHKFVSSGYSNQKFDMACSSDYESIVYFITPSTMFNSVYITN